MTNSKFHYLAYGMLTDPGIMRRGEYVGPARVPGYELEMLAFANIQVNPVAQFTGVLWEIDRTILRELDQIEGYPDFYTRFQIETYPLGQSQPINAWVYMMNPDSRLMMLDRQPSRNYLRSVENGYANAGIPYPF